MSNKIEEHELHHIVLNGMIWVHADDVYHAVAADKELIMTLIDAEDFIRHDEIELISEWALLAIDVQLKKDKIDRKFILI